MATAMDLARDFTESQKAAQKWFDDHKNAEGQLDVDAEGVKTFREMQSDLKAKREAMNEAQAVEAEAKENAEAAAALKAPQRTIVGGRMEPEGPAKQPTKSLGELFTQSPTYKEFLEKGKPKTGNASIEVDLDGMYGKGRGFKTLFTTSSSFAVESLRLPDIITPARRALSVADLMPEGRTSQPVIKYMEETTTTEAAAETTEGDPKPEAAVAFTERTSTVRKIAVSLPVTDESLEDIPFIESYLEGRLGYFVQKREDSQLLVGDGSAPNLRGLLNVSGINTQARGADASQDAIYKGAIAAEVASEFPADGVVMHPTNWQTIRLMTTADGIYLFGPPSQPGDDSLWGWRVVKTTGITANTGLVGAFQAAAMVFRRSGLAMSVGWVNAQFVENERTILVEERLALVCFRPSAFTKVTGLN